MKIFFISLFAGWKWRPFFRRLPGYLLSSFGSLWLIAEIASFFSEHVKLLITAQWLIFGLIGILVAVFSSWPKSSFIYELNGRDVKISIKVGDAFQMPGALIVPINTTFDTDLDGLIARSPSIQGKLLRDYYENQPDHLDLDIEKAIARESYQIQEVIPEKPGKKNRYELGSVLQIRKKDRLFYLMALTHISNYGRATAENGDFYVALAKLWSYIMDRGDKCEIVIPVLGTGHARLALKKDDAIKEIIRSFIAACSEKTFCGNLTIAVYPTDLEKINIDDLDDFLRFSCKFSAFDSNAGTKVGRSLQ